VKVKVCGITNIQDALIAVKEGSGALGFVFYRRSKRYIMPEKARQIIRQLPGNILKVGVFVDAKETSIRNIARLCGLDALQFHGNESPEFCRRFRDYRIIKAFRISQNVDFGKIAQYKTYAYLFDTYSKSEFGGTGKTFSWRLLEKKGKIKKPVILSGGLNSRNVVKAIRIINPDWVDVSSSVESMTGKKDKDKLARFIRAVRKGSR